MPNQVVPQIAASTSEFTYVYGSGSSIAVDAGVVITQPANSFPLDGIFVTILRNFTSGDKLTIAGSTATTADGKITYTGGLVPAGVSAVYDTTNGVLKCVSNTSDAYRADTWQAIARAVEFSSTAVSANDTSRGISFTLGEKQALMVTSGNSTKPHYYEFVPSLHTSWTAARADATTKTFFGLRGYLACITSEEENNFVSEKIRQPNGNLPRGWIGGTDRPTGSETVNGQYVWVDGPEAGQAIVSQLGAAGQTAARNAGIFHKFTQAEPNNVVDPILSPQGEHYVHIMPSGTWNDLPNDGPVITGNNGVAPAGSGINQATWTYIVDTYSLQGYIIEYGGFEDDPELTISTAVNINLRSVDNAAVEQVGDVSALAARVTAQEAVTAPTGAQGPAGATGPTGPQGAAGETGAVGPQGPAGVRGATGATGAAGPRGATGDQGETGATGPAGVRGATGLQGPAGIPGAEGAQGPAGAQGVPGLPGSQGAVGETGAQGAQGPAGIQGPVGAQGAAADDFDGVARVTALEAAVTTREAAQAIIDGGIADGLTPAEVAVIKAAVDDSLVTDAELAAGFADVDARLDCLEARLAAVTDKLGSKRVLVVKQLNLSFDCEGNPV